MKMIARLLLTLVFLGATAQHAAAQRKINERRAVVPAGFIRIAVPEGEVRVIGWNRDSLAVTGAAAAGFTVEITKQGAKVGYWTESDTKPANSTVTVYVPARSQVWVKTAGAAIVVASLTGTLDLFSVSGAVTVSGNAREVYAETMAGAINLNNLKSLAARVKTASGVIKVDGEVADLTLVSVSGDINSSMSSFGRARFESVDGQIRHYGPIPPAAVLDVINHAGSITLVIPPKTSADFAFNLYDADLTDEFGIKKRWMMSNKFKGKEMTFGIGDRPNARVTIRSFKGPVAIRRIAE
jgi:DUF4097 and DUF4098 domain-containing protein YvlB